MHAAAGAHDQTLSGGTADMQQINLQCTQTGTDNMKWLEEER